MGTAKSGLGRFAGDLLRPQVGEAEMVVGAARHDVDAALHQLIRHGGGVCLHLRGIGLEPRPQRLAEGDGLGGDDMHQGAALKAGEDGRVDLLRDVLVIAQDHAAARAAQRLVRGGRHDMRMGQGGGMDAARHQTRDMGHVDMQIGADFVRDGAERGPVPFAAIGGAARQDQLRLMLKRLGADVVHIQPLILLAHAVGDHVEPLARHVDGRAMGQVTAGIQVKAHEGVAGLQQRQEHSLVHLAAGVGLDVGEVAAEKLFRPLDRQRLGHVDELAAAVVALSGITFGIFVGQDRTLRLQYGQ